MLSGTQRVAAIFVGLFRAKNSAHTFAGALTLWGLWVDALPTDAGNEY